MPEKKVVVASIGVIVAIIVVVAVVVVPLSFTRVEYYQFGILRSRFTGELYRDRVYPGGIYPTGPTTDMKIFQASAHSVEFNSVAVFASDRLEVDITCSMQYFLREHQLVNLNDAYSLEYHTILENNALDALKGATTMFSTREFIRDRETIEQTLFKAVRDRLGGPCCELNCKSEEDCKASDCKPFEKCVDGCITYSKCKKKDYGLFAEVRYFQLNRLEIPNELNQRYLQKLTLQEAEETEEYKQDALLYRKDTQKLVQNTQNQAHEVRQNATVEAELTKTRSVAEADANIQRAKMQGLEQLYMNTNMTDAQQRASFDLLRTLKGNERIKMAYNFQQYLSGPH